MIIFSDEDQHPSLAIVIGGHRIVVAQHLGAPTKQCRRVVKSGGVGVQDRAYAFGVEMPAQVSAGDEFIG